MKNYRVEWRHNYQWRMDDENGGTFRTLREAKEAELKIIRAHNYELETRIVAVAWS